MCVCVCVPLPDLLRHPGCSCTLLTGGQRASTAWWGGACIAGAPQAAVGAVVSIDIDVAESRCRLACKGAKVRPITRLAT